MADQRAHLDAFVKRHRLPAAFAKTATRFYDPLCTWVADARRDRGRSGLVIGVNGAQGTGKSTLCDYIAERLQQQHGYRAAVLSIDDIYLTRAERATLADTTHPLLRTRGVPGTHDVALGLRTLDALSDLTSDDVLALPRFDKAVDDRCAPSQWPEVRGPIDVVLFEGWCVGARAEPSAALAAPINALERSEDPDGAWRRYVNDALAREYAALFDRLDRLVYLAFPGFESIVRWRTEQEHKLAARAGDNASGVMSDAQVVRFIQHYERITRYSAERLSQDADAVLTLDDDHGVTGLTYRDGSAAGG